jgi:hypothetical protein
MCVFFQTSLKTINIQGPHFKLTTIFSNSLSYSAAPIRDELVKLLQYDKLAEGMWQPTVGR